MWDFIKSALAAVGLVVIVLNGITSILKATLDIWKHVEDRRRVRKEKAHEQRVVVQFEEMIATLCADPNGCGIGRKFSDEYAEAALLGKRLGRLDPRRVQGVLWVRLL